MLRNDSSFPTQSNTPNINLREDEKLLWSGRPKRGLVVQRYSVKGIVRGLLLTGFAT